MTVLKTKAVTSKAHLANLASYLNDERAIARSSQWISNEDRWSEEMQRTREAYGHDVPSRAGTLNTEAYHVVIGFLPEEADLNGGPMTAERCMAYAKEVMERLHADQEACWVLHVERSSDGVRRYCVHAAVNRSDLSTGKRYDMGPSRLTKAKRAAAIRDLDEKYGLKQLEAGRRNSAIHSRQPSREEKAMAARGALSDKQYLRNAVKRSLRDASSARPPERIDAFKKALEAKGVRVTMSANGHDLTYRRERSGFKANGTTLGKGYSLEGVHGGLGASKEAARTMKNELEIE